MKVRQEKYGNRSPKLTPDDLDGDFAVLTIAAFAEETFTDEEGERVTPCLEFQEMGDKRLWVNGTQVGYLVERLGDETDAWKGQQVPVEKHVSVFRGKRYNKLWIAAPEEWDTMLAQAGVKPRRATKGKVKGKVKR